MAIVTTDISPKTLSAKYDTDGVTVTGLRVSYMVTLSHDGVMQPEPITKSVDVWAGLNSAAKTKVQDIFDDARTLLEG